MARRESNSGLICPSFKIEHSELFVNMQWSLPQAWYSGSSLDFHFSCSAAHLHVILSIHKELDDSSPLLWTAVILALLIRLGPNAEATSVRCLIHLPIVHQRWNRLYKISILGISWKWRIMYNWETMTVFFGFLLCLCVRMFLTSLREFLTLSSYTEPKMIIPN